MNFEKPRVMDVVCGSVSKACAFADLGFAVAEIASIRKAALVQFTGSDGAIKSAVGAKVAVSGANLAVTIPTTGSAAGDIYTVEVHFGPPMKSVSATI